MSTKAARHRIAEDTHTHTHRTSNGEKRRKTLLRPNAALRFIHLNRPVLNLTHSEPVHRLVVCLCNISPRQSEKKKKKKKIEEKRKKKERGRKNVCHLPMMRK